MFEPIVINIPKYVREIQLSKAQRPKYYFLDRGVLKAKGKKFPISMMKEKPKDVGKDCYNWTNLKDEYKLVIFHKKKIIGDYETMLDYIIEKNLMDHYKVLVCDLNNNPIISNPTKVGKPKIEIISGQDIYSGNMHEHTRVKIMDLIKVQMFEALEDIKPIEHYPIRIEMELHDTVKNVYDRSKDMDKEGGRWDVGNRSYPYGKAFCDVLSELKIVRDDDRLSITQEPLGAVFCPLPDNDDSKRFLRFIIRYDDREIIKNNKFYGGKDIKS